MTTQTTKPKAAKRGLLERLDNDAVVCAEVRYIRLCCGAAPHHIRAVAEAIGRTTASSRYSGLSQILAINGMLTIGGEICAPNVTERTDDSECHCREAEAPVQG